MPGSRLILMVVFLVTCAVGSAWSFEGELEFISGSGNSFRINGKGGNFDLSQRGREITVKYKVPVTLDDAIASLKIWCNPAPMVKVWALVEDEAGKTYRFPFRMALPMYNTHNKGWGRYGTGDLHVNPNAYTSVKVKTPLRLVGFVLRHNFNGSGGFSLGWLSYEARKDYTAQRWEIASFDDPMVQRTWRRISDSGRFFINSGNNNQPNIPLSKIVSKPGKYTVDISIRSSWQGAVVASSSKVIDVTSESLGLPESGVLIIPTPAVTQADESYFMRVNVRDSDGALVSYRDYWLNLLNWKSAAEVAASKADIARMSLECGNGGVLSNADKAECTLALSGLKGYGSPLELEVTLLTYDFNKLEQSNTKVKPAKGDFRLQLSLAEYLKERNVMRVHALLKSGGKVIDRQSMVVGVRGTGSNLLKSISVDSAKAKSVATNRVTLGSTFLLSYLPPEGFTRKEYLQHIRQGMKWVKTSGQSYVDIQIPWLDVEVLEGVYNFTFLDEIIQVAQQEGVKVTLTIWNFADTIPRWLFTKPMRYDDGSTGMYCRSRFAVDFAHPIHMKAMSRMWDTVSKRYGKCDTVDGYMVMGTQNDAGYIDIIPYVLAGYSPAFLEQWREYLLERYGSLEKVAAAHGQKYKDVSSLLLPRPVVQGEYDKRRIWRDFADFRIAQLSRHCENIYKTIRANDPECELFQYGLYNMGTVERFFPLYKKYNVGLTAGTSEFEHLQRYSSLAALWGINYRGEPAAAQAVNVANFNMGMWDQLPYQIKHNSYSVQWHQEFPADWNNSFAAIEDLKKWDRAYSNPLSRIMKYGMPEVISEWTAVFEKISGAQAMTAEVGCFFSGDWSAIYSRNFSSGHITGKNIFRMINRKLRRVPNWVSEYTPLPLMQKLKVIMLDADTKIAYQPVLERLLRYVDEGGVMIASVESFMQSVESDIVDYPLLKALGVRVEGAAVGSSVSAALRSGAEKFYLNNYYKLSCKVAGAVEYKDDSGKVVCIKIPRAKGWVYLLAGAPDYNRSAPAFDQLLTELGQKKVIELESENANMRTFCLKKDDSYFFAAGYLYNGYEVDYASGKPKYGKNEFVSVKIHGMQYNHYRIRRLTPGQGDYGIVSSQKINEGLSLYLKPGELALFECVPVK